MKTGNICQRFVLLVVIVRHVASATDGNDICQKELLFERLIELEYKVKAMEKELEHKVTEMDKEMTKTNVGLIGLLDAQNRRIEELASTTQERNGTKLVAFSSYNPVSRFPMSGEIIVFNSTQLNEGNAYNTITGEFTVPDYGLYEFSAHICNAEGKFIVYTISINTGKTLALSTQWDDTNSCGSLQALALLKTGEKVFLKCVSCESGVYLMENQHRRNAFIGVKLH